MKAIVRNVEKFHKRIAIRNAEQNKQVRHQNHSHTQKIIEKIKAGFKK
jgi:hypothetical protein